MRVLVALATTAAAAAALPSVHAALPSTMQAVHAVPTCHAPFSCVTAATVDVPLPGPGQVLIHVGGASVNPCDSDSVQGYPGCPQNKAGTPGGDVAGTVVSLGTNVTRLKLGDKVWANR